MSTIYLVFYSLLWLLTLVFYYKKKKRFDAGIFLICLFFVYSVFSVILYKDSGRGVLFFGGKEITLFPLIYLYLMIMLTMSPIINFNQDKISRIQKPTPILIDAIFYFFIFMSILKIPGDIELLSRGLKTIMLDAAGGLEIYDELMAESSLTLGDGKISNLPSIITNLLRGVSIIIFWYYIIIGKNKWYIYTLGFFLLLNPFLSLAQSQRGPAIANLLSLAATYFMLIRFIPDSIKRKIRIGAIVVTAVFLIPFMAISHSRFDRSDGGVQSSFVYYIGQENLYFDIYAFDNNGLRYGDRVVPMFKRILGFENVPHNFWERRQKYPNLKINDEVFIGYVGDFVLDFGPIITFFIFLFFTPLFFSLLRIRGGTLYFYQLIPMCFLLQVGAIGGMKLFPFADDGALSIFTYIIAFFLFKIDEETKLKQEYIYYE